MPEKTTMTALATVVTDSFGTPINGAIAYLLAPDLPGGFLFAITNGDGYAKWPAVPVPFSGVLQLAAAAGPYGPNGNGEPVEVPADAINVTLRVGDSPAKPQDILLPPASFRKPAGGSGDPSTGELVVITHPTMSANDSAWRWKGFTDFLLFYRFLIGEDIGPLLKERLKVGATVLRVFSMVAWDDISPRFYPQDFSDYYSTLRAFIKLLAENNLRCELTVFADAQIVMPDADDREAHLDRVVETLDDCWNVFIEVANEPFKNLPGGNDEAVQLAQRIQGCGLLVAAGNYDARSPEDWRPWPPGDYGTTHVARVDDWPRKCKDIFDLAMDGGPPDVPWIGDEPLGAAEENDPGRRSNVAPDFGWYAAGCAMFGPGATFHSDAGCYSLLLGPEQTKCAEAFFAALSWVPAAAPFWPYQRGDMGSEEGIGNMPILHDDAIELRTYCKSEGGRSWCIQIRTTRAHATPRDGWRVVAEPYPGFVYLEK
jgi:hypothetical protein